MARWDIYIEYAGYPIEATFDFPDTYEEGDVWETVHEDIIIEVSRSG